jgi:hypothetical protein
MILSPANFLRNERGQIRASTFQQVSGGRVASLTKFSNVGEFIKEVFVPVG